MARAARHARDQAARLGLLAAVAAATGCASIQEPPGGPPDFDPPVIVRVVPDSGAAVDGFRDDAVIEFDEVISERSAGGLENLVRLSPRPEGLSVSWRRRRIAIKPEGGWKRGVVYHLTLLPGVADLRNNRLDSSRTIIFSTGGPIPDARLTGTVVNWEEGRAGTDALIEAILLPDSLVYTTQADSVGDYDVFPIPPGEYLVVATVDRNGNGLRDAREAFDSTSVRLDSIVTNLFWAFAHDTLGPRASAELLDSVTVRLNFTQKLAPDSQDSAAVSLFSLPDTLPVALAGVWTQAVYDSVQAAARALADSIAADSATAADSAVARDSLPAAPRPPRAQPGERPAAPEVDAPADTSRAAGLLAQRPRLLDALIIRMTEPLTPQRRYLVRTRATNVSGAVAESEAVVTVPAAPDST